DGDRQTPRVGGGMLPAVGIGPLVEADLPEGVPPDADALALACKLLEPAVPCQALAFSTPAWMGVLRLGVYHDRREGLVEGAVVFSEEPYEFGQALAELAAGPLWPAIARTALPRPRRGQSS